MKTRIRNDKSFSVISLYLKVINRNIPVQIGNANQETHTTTAMGGDR